MREKAKFKVGDKIVVSKVLTITSQYPPVDNYPYQYNTDLDYTVNEEDIEFADDHLEEELNGRETNVYEKDNE